MLFSSNCFIIRTTNFSGQNMRTESFGLDCLIRGIRPGGAVKALLLHEPYLKPRTLGSLQAKSYFFKVCFKWT